MKAAAELADVLARGRDSGQQVDSTRGGSLNKAMNMQVSRVRLWTGRIITGFGALFLFFDGAMKIVKPAAVIEATAKLGFPEAALTGIGLVLIACTVLYVIPRTSILGAVFLTGYLGGAVATQVRAGMGWFETSFPVLFGALIWSGVWLRDQRVKMLLE
jgi:hypothetical protein